MKKIIKYLLFFNMLLLLILGNCSIDTPDKEDKEKSEDFKNNGNMEDVAESEVIAEQSELSRASSGLSNFKYYSLKQTYNNIASQYTNGTTYVYSYTTEANEYTNASKNYGTSHNLHVRKFANGTLYTPFLEYGVGDIWTSMDVGDGMLVLYSAYESGSDGYNFRCYGIQSDGSLKKKFRKKLPVGYKSVKLCHLFFSSDYGSGSHMPSLVLLKNDGSDSRRLRIYYFNYDKSGFSAQDKVSIRDGFNYIVFGWGDDDIHLYSKYLSGKNLYRYNAAYERGPDEVTRLPYNLDDVGLFYLGSNVCNLIYVKQTALDNNNHHLIMLDQFYNILGSYLTDDGWSKISDGYNRDYYDGDFIIIHKTDTSYNGQINVAIAE